MERNQSENKIWQRVFALPAQSGQELRPLILAAMESAEAFRTLTNSLTGTGKEQARALYRSQMETVSVLKGLEALSGGSWTGKPLPQPRESARRMLEKAYHRAKNAVAEYTARSLDSDFGVVFRELTRQEEARCAAIAGLLGLVG